MFLFFSRLTCVSLLTSIRQLQSGSTAMATFDDSARIASMAKRRKTRTSPSLAAFASADEIDVELSSTVRDFVDQIHHGYVMHLKVTPRFHLPELYKQR